MLEFFSVQPLCSLYLRGGFSLRTLNHRAKNTELPQRRVLRRDFPAKAHPTIQPKKISSESHIKDLRVRSIFVDSLNHYRILSRANYKFHRSCRINWTGPYRLHISHFNDRLHFNDRSHLTVESKPTANWVSLRPSTRVILRRGSISR
jgi:hypothetical protein